MIDASQVSAVIVTRGDVDLRPILATLPYDEVIVWDNSRKPWDARCFGRYLAIAEAAHDVIYHQDDDILFTAHEALLAAYEPGRITANMPSPWWERTGYDKIDCQLVGAGSLSPRDLHHAPFDAYLADWPLDELFLTYADQVYGILAPGERYDFGYEILPHATAPGRIATLPGQAERKWTVQARALALRSVVPC